MRQTHPNLTLSENWFNKQKTKKNNNKNKNEKKKNNNKTIKIEIYSSENDSWIYLNEY